MKVFCLAFAGGSARRFRRLFPSDPPGLQIVPVEYAGRGSRSREKPYATFAEALDDLVPRIVAEEPYALLGHSLGALLAFELAHLFTRQGRPPEALIVSGRNPVHLPPGGSELRRPDVTDEQLMANLSAAGSSVPAGSGPLISDTFLPVLRADLGLANSYRRVEQLEPLPCPIIALSGTDDPFTMAGAMRQWQRHTSGQCAVHEIQGGHFFLFDQPAVIGMLLTRIASGTEQSQHHVLD